MAKSYGKFRGKRRRAPPVKRVENVRAGFTGKAGLEQMSAAFQTLIAALQEQGVQGVEKCAFFFAPLDQAGNPMLIRDRSGAVVEKFEISIPGAAPESIPQGVRRLVSPAVFVPETDKGTVTKNVLTFNSRAC